MRDGTAPMASCAHIPSSLRPRFLVAARSAPTAEDQALPLLPLLDVAWADNEIQEGERALVEAEIAKRRLGIEAERVVRNWLTYRPTPDYIARGRTALIAVARRSGDLKLDDNVLSDVVALSKAVAKAAGGLWGIGSISSSERTSLDSIAAALDIGDGTEWEEQVEQTLAAQPQRQRVLIKFNTDTLDLGNMPGVLTPVANPDLQIPVEGTLVLGSDPGADVIIEDREVSARHCEVRLENTMHYVKDLGHSGGTYVDGERIVERRLLGGEAIRVGFVELKFQLLRRVPNQLL